MSSLDTNSSLFEAYKQSREADSVHTSALRTYVEVSGKERRENSRGRSLEGRRSAESQRQLDLAKHEMNSAQKRFNEALSLYIKANPDKETKDVTAELQALYEKQQADQV